MHWPPLVVVAKALPCHVANREAVVTEVPVCRVNRGHAVLAPNSIEEDMVVDHSLLAVIPHVNAAEAGLRAEIANRDVRASVGQLGRPRRPGPVAG